MTALVVVGGVYHERCTWPEWNNTFGSGGRAAAAVVSHLDSVRLESYATAAAVKAFEPWAKLYEFDFVPHESKQFVSFDYVHCLSNPIIRPSVSRIHQVAPIEVQNDAILRFGMLEGSGKIHAKRCVYDPQSAFDPETFQTNGSEADELAIVANRGEIVGMTGENDPKVGAKQLIADGAKLVVVKSGSEGAWVVTEESSELVPAFRSERVWTIGSGDVFAGVFAARWAVNKDEPIEAAYRASKAVAFYAENMSLPVPRLDDLDKDDRPKAVAQPGKVYLASPFFTMGQRWLVEEARRGLRELGLDVFSPVHEIGPGPAEIVAPLDLAALDESDLVFAILDGNDSGTLFEVGYATAKGKPTYALAQNVGSEDLKMVQGSGARIYNDFVTALHHTVWRA